MILGAAYTLWMYKRVMFGVVTSSAVEVLSELNMREAWILGILAAAVLFFGVYPDPLLNMMHVSVEQLVEHIAQSKIN